jgi:hypothetical protein
MTDYMSGLVVASKFREAEALGWFKDGDIIAVVAMTIPWKSIAGWARLSVSQWSWVIQTARRGAASRLRRCCIVWRNEASDVFSFIAAWLQSNVLESNELASPC